MTHALQFFFGKQIEFLRGRWGDESRHFTMVSLSRGNCRRCKQKNITHAVFMEIHSIKQIYCTKCSIFCSSNYQHPSFSCRMETHRTVFWYTVHKCKNAKKFHVLNKTLTLRSTWFESTAQAPFCLGWTRQLVFTTPLPHHPQRSFCSHDKTLSFARLWHKALFRSKTVKDEWLLHLTAFVGGGRMST